MVNASKRFFRRESVIFFFKLSAALKVFTRIHTELCQQRLRTNFTWANDLVSWVTPPLPWRYLSFVYVKPKPKLEYKIET